MSDSMAVSNEPPPGICCHRIPAREYRLRTNHLKYAPALFKCGGSPGYCATSGPAKLVPFNRVGRIEVPLHERGAEHDRCLLNHSSARGQQCMGAARDQGGFS